MTSQEQKGGMGSTNVQVGQVTVGMSYRDVKDIALDIYYENAEKLKDEAARTAEARVNELLDTLVEKLKKEHVNNIEGLKHPEKQVAVLNAQKAFILSGDDQLKSMLVDSIASLVKEPERSLKSIVLQESINVFPALTSKQMAALTLVFLTRFVVFNGASNISEVLENIKTGIGSASSDLNFTDGDFRHLEYSRCGTVQLLNSPLGELIRKTYPGLVSTGTSREALIARFHGAEPEQIFATNILDHTQYQIAAVNEWVIDAKKNMFGWSDEEAATAKTILNEMALPGDEVISKMRDLGGFPDMLIQAWDGRSVGRFTLSSVGMAIGHGFAVSNGLELGDLSVWL